MAEPVCVLFNPRCSKCRQARDLLEARGVAFRLRHYLDEPLDRPELETLLESLGTEGPRPLIRQKDPLFETLGLAEATDDQLLEALVTHPSLMERPVVIRDGRAVIARPPERLNDLF